MIVVLERGADSAHVQRMLVEHGLWVVPLEGGPTAQFLVEPQSAAPTRESLLGIAGVEAVAAPRSAHPLVDEQPPIVGIGATRLGPGAPPVFVAGPCSVESEEQIHSIAARLARQGVRLLRGGAFKPRTSPYAFQGHGETALAWMRAAADANGLSVVTEVLDPRDAPAVARFADLLQIGSRNMQNFALLRAAAREHKPVLIKRGMAATIDEWLLAGEHCLLHGAPAVVFCERGIRGFDSSTRNLLDLGAVALLSQVYRLPVIVDPSHAVGRRDLVPVLSRAAIAAGAAGLMLETHDEPGRALSDGPQALLPDQLAELLADLGAER